MELINKVSVNMKNEYERKNTNTLSKVCFLSVFGEIFIVVAPNLTFTLNT